MSSRELRKKFFEFFKSYGHEIVPSSSLVPADDPTLLFTNAGMNQFKDVFLGKTQRPYKRAVSIQKCIRAGGKHDDLANVGITKRHLTFFEMMGNFSFGDYFKKEAITFAWEFVTKVLELPKEKLNVTVFVDDNESWRIWNKEIKLPSEQIFRLGTHDNFWQMGDTGPCGPCSEIYIDRGPSYGCGKENCAPGCSCERYLEFWNLVFMEFDRQEDGTDKLLKHKGVDTGMGLERLSTIMQNVDSIFETDLFTPLIQALEQLTGLSYNTAEPKQQIAFRVLADHIRSTCLAIADGALPSNEGRGYVIRKIIRRAALFSQKLTNKTIFPDLADTFMSVMGSIYPELIASKDLIKKILKEEIEKFSHNLESGKKRLESYLQQQPDIKSISGKEAFKLYDTYGFPIELTLDIAKESGLAVDVNEFNKEMEKQKLKSGKKEKKEKKIELPKLIKTTFTGYDQLEISSNIIALISNDALVKNVASGQDVWLITDTSPFFVEKGGQVSDRGFITINQTKTPIKKLKYIDEAIAVLVKTPTDLSINDTITLEVDREFRLNTMKNHTATHLLQGALITILGPQVRQSGSLVTADYLRFDFTYPENLSKKQIEDVELLVNKKIMENIKTNIYETSYKEAINSGVIAIFDEKYNPEKVRVVDIPGFSSELCGGTHVHATGEIGCFKITEVSALSAGNRRIVAITGPEAIKLFQDNFSTIKELAMDFKVKVAEVKKAVEKQRKQLQEAQIYIKNLKKKIITTQIPQWQKHIESINEIPYLFLILENYEFDELRIIAEILEQKKPGFYFIVSNTNQRSIFFALLSHQYSTKLIMKNLEKNLHQMGLHGGGTHLQLQGGGKPIDITINNLIKNWIEKS